MGHYLGEMGYAGASDETQRLNAAIKQFTALPDSKKLQFLMKWFIQDKLYGCYWNIQHELKNFLKEEQG